MGTTTFNNRGGGKLEITKCAVYTMKWNFDEQGIPYLDNNCKVTIHISSSETKTQQIIPYLSNHVPFKYLGVSSDIQFQESLHIAKKVARILSSTNFYHTQAKLYTNAYVNQKKYYPFPSVSFSSKQYSKINKAYIPQVISSMEYNRTWPTELRYGCHDYGSLQIKHSEVESLIRKIKAFHNLLAKKDTKYVINLIIQWFQHVSGSTYPCLENPPYILNYINSYWMSNFVLLLQKYEIKLLVTTPYTPKDQRFNDSCIMNNILKIMSSRIQRQQLNACRLYLDVTFLSDITSINGNFLLPGVITGDKRCIMNSNQEGTTQAKPYNKSWKLWARTITSLYCIKANRTYFAVTKKWDIG